MSKIALDLKMFRHKHSDGKTTTLEHIKDKHTITLHHNVLSKPAQDQLQALAGAAKDAMTPNQANEAEAEQKQASPYGKVSVKSPAPKKMASGGDVRGHDDYVLEGEAPSIGGDLAAAGNYITDKLGKAANYLSGADQVIPRQVAAQETSAPQPDVVAQQQAPVLDLSQEKAQVDQQQAPQASAEQPQATGQEEDEQQQEAPATEAQPQAPQQQAASANHQPVGPQSFTQHVDQLRDHYSNEDKAWQNDLNNGHITPKTYESLFADKSTPGKIGTLFGLLVGGIGAGLTHSENPIIAQMDKVISNDIEAQKMSKQNAHNFLRLSEEHDKNQADISLMGKQGKLTEAQARLADTQASIASQAATRMKMNRVVLHKLAQTVQSLPMGSPQRQQAEQQLAMLSSSVDAQNYGLADVAASRSALMNYAGGDSANSPEAQFQAQNRMLRMSGNEKMANDREEKHFPGLQGQASAPLTQKDREELTGHSKLNAGLNDLLDFVQHHSTVIPGTPSYNVGQAKVRKLQADIRDSVLNTVYREGEQPLLDKFIASNPAGIEKFWKTIPQLKTLMDSSNRDYNSKLQSLGFPSQPQTGMQQQSSTQPQIIVNKQTGERRQWDAQSRSYIPVKR